MPGCGPGHPCGHDGAFTTTFSFSFSFSSVSRLLVDEKQNFSRVALSYLKTSTSTAPPIPGIDAALPPGAEAPLSSYCQNVYPEGHAVGIEWGAGCV
jgi:hypothetical protein